MSWTRRRLLRRATAGAFVTGIAGCLGGDRAVGVPPEETDCPFYERDEVVKAVPSDRFGDGETPIRLARSDETVELPRDEISFTLTNETDRRFETNFYSWRVWKRVDGDWFHLFPQMWPQPLMSLPSGESHTWTLAIDNDDSDGLGLVESTDGALVAGLGGGTYAFETDGWFENRGHEEKTGFCARFAADGEPIDVAPTDDVTWERDGHTVVVTDANPLDEKGHGGDARMAAFVVTRTEPVADAERMIPEQVVRARGIGSRFRYRNTLPLFEEGVDEVRYETVDASYPVFGLTGPRTVAYEGEYFRVTAEEL
jgi:hypothetical protein